MEPQSGKIVTLCATISSIRILTNTLFRRPICKFPRPPSRTCSAASMNGLSRNCIRRSRCCIIACIGTVPTSRPSRALWPALTCGQPNFFYGFAPADFTAHTTVRQFDVIPELSYFVAPARGKPEWQNIPTAETEVFIDERNGDVALRKRGSHEYLGSFSRYWIIPAGLSSVLFRTRSAHAAFALWQSDCATRIMDRERE